MASTVETVFLGIPKEFTNPDTARAAIIPVPYDRTSSWKKGADKGPAALINASGTVELFDIETKSEPYRDGIATLPPVECAGPPEEMSAMVAERISAVLAKKQIPVVLGGEHSVSIGAVQATAKRYPKLSVLQIDAHGDTREEYEGSTHNHACIMARAREVAEIVQVGIRAVERDEYERMDLDRVYFAHDIAKARQNRDDAWMDRIVEQLTDHVYLTIDLDAFDPAFIPATGTPEPGGLDWYTVNELIRRVIAKKTIVAFDVVELLPTPGEHASDFFAAKLVHRILAMLFAKP